MLVKLPTDLLYLKKNSKSRELPSDMLVKLPSDLLYFKNILSP